MKIRIILILLFAIPLISLSTALQTAAQDPEQPALEMSAAPPPLPPLPPGEGDRFLFISSEFEMQKLVKGAPYSAQAVTERVQELADGNRITQKNTSDVFRDSEGRTRREQNGALIGPWTASSDEAPHTIFIHDPAAHTDYILDEKEKTARKVTIMLKEEHAPAPPGKPVNPEDHFELPAPPPPHGSEGNRIYRFYEETTNAKTESLGKQMMEGIAVEGTRVTSTIAAGKIGNERPIEIVSEKWYSPELQVYIMTRHSDPRFGETTYHLTNISRRDPDPSLFRVPEDYKITDAPGREKIVIRKEIRKD